MTSPQSVGAVEIEVLANAKGLTKSLRKEIEDAFKGLDFSKLIQDAIGDKPFKVKVEPEFDRSKFKDLPLGGDEKTAPTRTPRTPKTPKVPVVVDPLFDAFRAELRKQTASLAKQVHVQIPIDGDTAGLRAELGSQLAELGQQLKVKVPAEPEDRTKLQAELAAQLREISDRIKVEVPVEADTKPMQEQVRTVKLPKAKVEVDPVLAQFQAEVRSQATALAKTVHANVPVGADTSGLRAQLGAQLAAIQAQTKVQVPTEPGAQAAYEAQLKAQLAEVAARVKQTVHVDVDVDKGSSASVSKLAGAFKSIIPDIGGIGGALGNLTSQAAQFASTAAAGGSRLATGLGAAAGPAGMVVSLLVSAATAAGALGVAAALLPPILAAAAGAAAAIPAALSGLGAGIGTLALGFKGISDAFKPKAGGGGGGAGNSAASQARQVAAASRQVEAARRGIAAANRQLEASERALAAAQRGVLAAQRAYVDSQREVVAAEDRARRATEAVSQARKDAAEDIDDLGRALRGAVISESEATQAINDALLALNEAKLTGNIPDIKRAQNAYDRAVLSLEEAKDTTQDLTAETEDANRKGVEGSDKVQSALQDQADAYDGVRQAQQGVLDAQTGIIDANDALASAYDGIKSAQDGVKSAADGLASANDALAASQEKVAAGSAGVGKELIKLAPNAQRFVDAIKRLKPAFEDLRLDVQQRLFAGLDKTVTNLGNAWIPALKTTLGSYADTFNEFFRNLGTSVTTPKFISDIQAGAEGARQGLEKIGASITTSLVPAFGALSKAAGPFLSALGDEIADIVTDFSNWVLQGEKTGALTSFFDRATSALHDIFTTGRLVTKIVGQIIGIIVGAEPTTGDSALDSFNSGLQKVSDWLADPKNQQSVRDFITKLQDAVKEFGKTFTQVNGFLKKLDNGESSGIGETIGRALISGLVAGMWAAVQDHLLDIIGFFTGTGPIISAIKKVLGIESPSTVFAEIGRFLIDGLIQGIGEKLGALGETIAQIPGIVIGALVGAGTWLVSTGKNAVIGLGNAIVSMYGTLRTWATGLKTTVVNALVTAGTWLYSTGRSVVSGLGSGISSLASWLRTAAGNIRVWVINALSNAGSWLLGTGQSVVSGLWNGIASLGGWLWDRVSSFASNYVSRAINWALGVNSPSKVTAEIGRYVSQGLAIGIDDEASKVQAAAERVAALAVPQVGDATLGLDGSMDAAISRSLSVADKQSLAIGWKSGASYDPVLRGLQEVIDVSFQNDPMAALTRG